MTAEEVIVLLKKLPPNAKMVWSCYYDDSEDGEPLGIAYSRKGDDYDTQNVYEECDMKNAGEFFFTAKTDVVSNYMGVK
tara:strand:- start:1993 stop:2229 length:237 start_codon:yes stop_codon:yes gene_type:complete